jgi:hypothetical protein
MMKVSRALPRSVSSVAAFKPPLHVDDDEGVGHCLVCLYLIVLSYILYLIYLISYILCLITYMGFQFQFSIGNSVFIENTNTHGSRFEAV